MYYYFAQFLPASPGSEEYSVMFPDLPGCVTCAEGLTKAFEMASDVLVGYLEVEMDTGAVLPSPSDYATAKAKAEAECRELGIEISEGTFYQLVPADPQTEKPVRLSISLQPRVVSLIDSKAKAEGMTRSGFIAHAAKSYQSGFQA